MHPLCTCHALLLGSQACAADLVCWCSHLSNVSAGFPPAAGQGFYRPLQKGQRRGSLPNCGRAGRKCRTCIGGTERQRSAHRARWAHSSDSLPESAPAAGPLVPSRSGALRSLALRRPGNVLSASTENFLQELQIPACCLPQGIAGDPLRRPAVATGPGWGRPSAIAAQGSNQPSDKPCESESAGIMLSSSNQGSKGPRAEGAITAGRSQQAAYFGKFGKLGL